jgi:hypothetical protein
MDNLKQGENSGARLAGSLQRNKGFPVRRGIVTGPGATMARPACLPIGRLLIGE